MSIVIFGDLFSFPEGHAATNRVHTYAKGFKENGINVYIICFSSTYTDNENGDIEGIKYYHPFHEKERSKYFVIRNWKKLKKYFTTYYLFKKINKEDKISAINSWTNLLSTHLFAWLLCKRWGAKLITEASEHPFRFYQHGIWKKMIGKVKFNIESRSCDGILCISR